MPTSYKHQLDTLLTKFGYYHTRNHIKQVLGAVPNSKDSLKDAVLTVITQNTDLQEKLDELGLLALQLNTRQVEIFNVHEDNKASLDSLFDIENTTDNLIMDAFPFPVEDKEMLRTLNTGKVYPVKSDSVVLGCEDYKLLLVSTVLEKDIEEPVAANHLSQDGLELQNNDTTFIMKRKVRTQLFHSVYWNSDKSRLILSVDRNVLSHSVSQEQLFVLRRFLVENGVDCGTATNVFGAIGSIYDATDGYITKLGHVTTDGNPVRIPLKGRQKCLKQDKYHMTGEGSGFVHAKFSVAKKWEFKVDDTSRNVEVEVALMGKPQMLDTAQPLTDFSVNKSRRLQDFDFAIEKVLSHIPTT